MFLSKEEVQEKRRIILHDAPFLIASMAIPTVMGAQATTDLGLNIYTQIPLFFIGTFLCMKLFAIITTPLQSEKPVGPGSDINSDYIRIAVGLPLFLFGLILEKPIIALWWSVGFGMVYSLLFWWIIKFLPKEFDD